VTLHTYGYDKDFRLVQSMMELRFPSGGSTLTKTSYIYDEQGRMSRTVQVQLDPATRVPTADQSGTTTQQEYDSQGRPSVTRSTRTGAAGGSWVSENFYDAQDRIVRVVTTGTYTDDCAISYAPRSMAKTCSGQPPVTFRASLDAQGRLVSWQSSMSTNNMGATYFYGPAP